MLKKEKRIKIREKYKEYKCKQYCVICGRYNSNDSPITFHRIEDGLSMHDFLRKTFSWNAVLRELQRTIPLYKECHEFVHSEDD